MAIDVAELMAAVARLGPREINLLHKKADVDASANSMHHTLGVGANQSSPGNHHHDGTTSKLILQGKTAGFPTVASSTYSQSQMQAVINALLVLGAGK